MRKHHPKNERIKRKYCIWLKDARQKSEHTIDQALAAISLFEESARFRDFAAFHIEQARAFKRQLAENTNPKTGEPYAKATIKSRLDAVKAFFMWLADQPGYRSRIRYADCEYFNLSTNDVRIATARRERPAPTVEQVHKALDAMPSETPRNKRDRSVIALALLTGARDDALASLSLRDIDIESRQIFQDARTVRTKFRKSFPTWFFPVAGNAETVVADWVTYLCDDLHYQPDDPLFPKTEMGLDANGQFAPVGLKREHWKNADAIRRIFKDAFTRAGLPPYHPHSIRKTLTRLGQELCQTLEEFTAWSQNLGHEDIKTTVGSYGKVDPKRQAEIILNVLQENAGPPRASVPDEKTVKIVLEHLTKKAAWRASHLGD